MEKEQSVGNSALHGTETGKVAGFDGWIREAIQKMKNSRRVRRGNKRHRAEFESKAVQLPGIDVHPP